MEYTIYAQLLLIYAIGGFLLFQHLHLKRKIKEQDIAHKKSLAEAGNAITDTLRVAFDNLKRNTTDHNKINTKLTEHNSRIHRLEQNHNRTSRDTDSRTKLKEDIINENEQHSNEND